MNKPTMLLRPTTAAFVLAALATGCTKTANVGEPISVDDQRKMLSLLMPARIEIVEPFTRVRSFDDDKTPDGIEVLLQAVNTLDNPGLMIVGDLLVELFEYVPASAKEEGRRLEHWDVEIATRKHQRRFWNQVTQMYELRLGVDPTAIPQGDRYVLVVTYTSPLGDHLTDKCLIHFRTPGAPLGTGPISGR